MMKRLALALIAASLPLAGNPGATVSGYILDSRTAVIRPVYGIPGAMRLGSALDLPFGVMSAVFGPAGDYALVTTDEQPPHAWLVQNPATAPNPVDLGAVTAKTRAVAVNAPGTAALLASPDTGTIQFASGLPQAPALSAAVSTGTLAGPVSAAALDDAGLCAVLGTGALETLCADGTSTRILPVGMTISALVVANKGQDLFFTDSAAQQAVMVRNYGQSQTPQVLAQASDGLLSPLAIQFINASQVLVADAGASTVFAIDPGGNQAMQTVALDAVPSQLLPLTDRTILLLNDVSALPFTIMDVQSMQTFFIPAN